MVFPRLVHHHCAPHVLFFEEGKKVSRFELALALSPLAAWSAKCIEQYTEQYNPFNVCDFETMTSIVILVNQLFLLKSVSGQASVIIENGNIYILNVNINNDFIIEILKVIELIINIDNESTNILLLSEVKCIKGPQRYHNIQLLPIGKAEY